MDNDLKLELKRCFDDCSYFIKNHCKFLNDKGLNSFSNFDNHMVDDINITDHIIEKPNNDWEEKWKNQSYILRKTHDFPKEPIVNKSTEPWYRKFENKKRKHKR